MSEEAGESTPSTKKKETVYTPVTMGDGRVVQFPGETKAVVDLIEKDGGVAGARWDFRNGETRAISLDDVTSWGLSARYLIHGIVQKHRDVYASDKDVDDSVESFDELLLQTRKGVWSERAAGGGGPGGSVLRRALVEATGLSSDKVREMLSGLTTKEKGILRGSDELRPIIQRLEASKVSAADTASVLAKVGLKAA